RTVKRYYADDSAATSVKVGYRQASYIKKPRRNVGFFFVRKSTQSKRQRVPLGRMKSAMLASRYRRCRPQKRKAAEMSGFSKIHIEL
ncbi:hypothetical protein, partial [Massilia sp. TSP1-1-2]|uniref:hypothetical protein n=1 Tax=Massilia sp. TSP1-1-2 TaxID=2804649 RepID=UPI003CE99E9D